MVVQMKIVHVTLVLGGEEKLAIWADVLLELFLELNHMLEDQLLLGRVLFVIDLRWVEGGVLELTAPFEFLVYHVLPLL